MTSMVLLGGTIFLFSPAANADGKLGNGSIVSNVDRILGTVGISREVHREPGGTIQANPLGAKVKSSAVTPVGPQVAGLIIRFTSEDVKRLSRANQPPPQSLVAEVASSAGVELVFGRAMSMDSYVFRFVSPISWADAQLVMSRIKRSANVEAVDPDALSNHLLAPNDTYANSQWNLQSPNSYAGAANLGPAWDITQGSTNTVVAVVDTGVRSHPEFAARLLPGYDFVSDPVSASDGGGRDADASDPGDGHSANECGVGKPAANSTWHGTHVTGILAATGNNSQGIVGINWNTRILPVRVLGKCGGTVSDIVDGMTWAAGLSVPGVPINPFPAKVINMSLGGANPGGCLPTSPYQVAINRIKAVGVLIVVAAGNSDAEAATFVPAACDGVMTVAAIGPYGDRASYSNYGFRGNVDISAPGGDAAFGQGGEILSTINSGVASPSADTYGYKQGTSMATPHVAGVASLALGLDPNIAPELLALSLVYYGRPFPANSLCASLYPLCGYSILDAKNTLNVVNALKPYLLVYEFKNTTADHYFRTSSAAENSNVLNGSAGSGWIDTKNYFLAWRDASQGALPVCRFYSGQFGSHFYTANAGECEDVKRNPVWSYEGIAYYAKVPTNGQCPAGTTPIYRAYNNRTDGNHRFSTDKAVLQALVAQKWIFEGIAMCGAG